MEGSSKREISELHRLSLGQSILIEYQLDGPDSEDSRIILERCTLDHSDFTNAQFILVENGQVMGCSRDQNYLVKYGLAKKYPTKGQAKFAGKF